jgi:phosphoribosylaminoimidazole-succinocarboxamide synthase
MNSTHEKLIRSLPLINQGKVRDIYGIDAETLLIVTTDRLSAFDVILPTPIEGKGIVLTQVANFWFEKLQHIIPNHLSQQSLDNLPLSADEKAELQGRAIVVNKLRPLPIEAIVRGYIIGSGWQDYQQTGKICGITLPEGLQMAEKLSQPLFTPSSKAEVGGHDMNISYAATEALIGVERAKQVREVSLALYQAAADYALQKGIIIADTKFEFGLDQNDQLVLIDEVLTPDSSRFWPVESYQIGSSPQSFDKQFVRDYLNSLDWDKQAPAPELPQEIVDKTVKKYQEVANLLM